MTKNFEFHCVVVMPAYGRKYSEPLEMLKDWNDGKDFKVLGGPYCSKRDTPFFKKIEMKVIRLYQETPKINLPLFLENENEQK